MVRKDTAFRFAIAQQNILHQRGLCYSIRQAVFGNVGTIVSYRVGCTDAEALENEFGRAFPATALADLDRYEAAVKLLEDGANREPFKAGMLPPMEKRTGRKGQHIAASRMRFAVRRVVIEEKLGRWMQ